MDKASQHDKTNRRDDGKSKKTNKKGGFAAPPHPSGTNPTSFDEANNKEEVMYKIALGKAKSMVKAMPAELQQAILTKSTIPPTLAFFDAMVSGLHQQATIDKHSQVGSKFRSVASQKKLGLRNLRRHRSF